MKLMDQKFRMISNGGSSRSIHQFHKSWRSKSNLAGETEVDSCSSSPRKVKQLLYQARMNDWRQKNSSAMLDFVGIFNCHDYAQASTVTILQGFHKILLQSSSIMPVDDEQIENKAKDMKKIDEKS